MASDPNDINERRSAEEALKRSEERYRSLIDATSQMVWTNTPDGEMRGPNPDWGDFTGQMEAEYQGYGWAQAVHPDDAQPTIDAWQKAVATRSVFVFEHRLRRHDGAYCTFAIRAVPVLEDDGTIREWVGVHTDITEQKRAAMALRESEARKRAVLEAALDCIITIDEHERVIEWNPAAETTFGYSRAQAVGQALSALIIPHSLRDAHGRGIAHYMATGEGPLLNRRIEVPALHADGTEFPVELTAVPITLDGHTLFTAYLRDLSERERSAAQQRAFLRDVLLSVTEGRLHLCHLPSDLPKPRPAWGEPLPVSRTGGLAQLRQQAKEAAAAHGFADKRWQDLVTAVSEAAMNAVVHGGGGQGRVCASEDTVQVWVEDTGTGIDVASLPQATLEKGYTTAGTLGHGMKMMLSTADRVWLLTGATGTTVVVEQDRLSPTADGLRA